ncbi:MAG TPA: hypothetical protein VIO94_16135 [Phenylobacterium sp.]
MSATSAICEHGCASQDDCQSVFGCNPPWLADMDHADLEELLDFANRVQSWSFHRFDPTTYGDAAEHFGVPVEQINRAVIAHYWMFTPDTDLPLAERRIEHDGE